MIATDLTLADFQYHLPEERIRQLRRVNCEDNRLLVRSAHGVIQHLLMRDLPQIIPSGSLLIANDSRVIPSRLIGNLDSGGAVELMLLESTQNGRWSAMGRPRRKLKEGRRVYFTQGVEATILSNPEQADLDLTVEFNCSGTEFDTWLDKNGYIPLPPYITRKNPLPAEYSEDRTLYQTIYAKNKGSVAAPTAGLHLTPAIVAALADRAINIAYVTLHVGAGTFLPVKNPSIADHVMHTERYRIPSGTYHLIKQQQADKRPIVFIGTTSLRCVEDFLKRGLGETAADTLQKTDIFIYPKNRDERYHPQIGDALFTNFHQPGSTLMMLVAALIGLDAVQEVYANALRNQYDFLSYGDGSLLWF